MRTYSIWPVLTILLLCDNASAQWMQVIGKLSQNYPNPFNPSTRIGYSIPKRLHVTLAIFNPLGQEVVTLVSTDIEAGYHTVQFDASNLASGVYFYQLQAGEQIQTRAMMILR